MSGDMTSWECWCGVKGSTQDELEKHEAMHKRQEGRLYEVTIKAKVRCASIAEAQRVAHRVQQALAGQLDRDSEVVGHEKIEFVVQTIPSSYRRG